MSPKQKAEDLLNKMQVVHYVKLGGKNSKRKGLPVSMYGSQVKQCAIVCIEEIIKASNFYKNHLSPLEQKNNGHIYGEFEERIDYWEQVKQEIIAWKK